MSSAPVSPTARVFRLPRSAYAIVLILLFCTVPLAFGTNGSHSADDLSLHRTAVTGIEFGPRALLLLIPIAAAFFIARTATLVSANGIRVRALFGAKTLPWSTVTGLSVDTRSVYAVQADGAVRLPCVRVADLGNLSLASDGHLPEIAQPTPKFAPARRRGR